MAFSAKVKIKVQIIKTMNRILYLSGTFPARSETFVYREVLGLLDKGIEVQTASVHCPAFLQGDTRVEELSQKTIHIYDKSKIFLLLKSIFFALKNPVKSFNMLKYSIIDCIESDDVDWSNFYKIIFHSLISIYFAHRLKNLDIAHIHAHMAHVPTTIAMYTAIFLGISFSFTGHAIDLFPHRILLKKKLERAKFVNCISKWHQNFYKNLIDRPDTDYPVIRCGVKLDTEAKFYPFDKRKIHILSVGRFVEKKGFDILVSAASELEPEILNKIHFILIGDGPEKENIEKIIRESPVNIDISLLGEQSNDFVLQSMRSIDIFILPCRVSPSGDRDGIPVVLMEAMAAGKCVISGDIVTIRELIDHEKSGIMIPPGDSCALANILRLLVEDYSRIVKLGDNARKKILEEFEMELNIKRILDTFKNHNLLN